MTSWMEHEFRQYPAYHPDLDALASVAEKIVPADGRDSRKKGNMPFLPVVTLAGRLGRDIAEFRRARFPRPAIVTLRDWCQSVSKPERRLLII